MLYAPAPWEPSRVSDAACNQIRVATLRQSLPLDANYAAGYRFFVNRQRARKQPSRGRMNR